jgi:hypothetical protein
MMAGRRSRNSPSFSRVQLLLILYPCIAPVEQYGLSVRDRANAGIVPRLFLPSNIEYRMSFFHTSGVTGIFSAYHE